MFRHLKAATPQELGKWCLYLLVLLTPGSFIAVPVFWLLSRYRSRLAGTWWIARIRLTINDYRSE
jgi:hypothetical protein